METEGSVCSPVSWCKMVSYQDVLKAYSRISSHIHKTPVHTSSYLDQLVGRQVFLKCEAFQKTGSFKARGALNGVMKLKETRPDSNGVVTHSSGNHGQALAWAAKVVGLPCSVVVPNNTPKVKAAAILGYGADLVYCEPNPQSREATCKRVSETKNQDIVLPFDDYRVIAGQGTIAVELLDQVPDLDAILVPISGGGMTSGIAIAAKAIKPDIKVFAVEPEGKELQKSLQAGERLWENPPRFINTIAEGIRFQQVGHLTFPIMCELVEKEVFTVNDDEMIAAMKLVFQRLKIVIEASSGAGVAAALSEKMRKMDPSIKKVGVILCGGNVDIDKLPWY